MHLGCGCGFESQMGVDAEIVQEGERALQSGEVASGPVGDGVRTLRDGIVARVTVLNPVDHGVVDDGLIPVPVVGPDGDAVVLRLGAILASRSHIDLMTSLLQFLGVFHVEQGPVPPD